jgi:TolA-binding protein
MTMPGPGNVQSVRAKCMGNVCARGRMAALHARLAGLLAIAAAACLLAACERDSRSGHEVNASAAATAAASSAAPTPVRKVNGTPATAPATPAAQRTPEDKDTIARETSHLKDELRDITGKIGELRERASQVSTTRTRERLAAAVTDLENRRRAIAEQLDHIDDWRTSASLAWSDIRDGLERAMKELRDAYDKARTHF